MGIQIDNKTKSLSNISYYLSEILEVIKNKQCKCDCNRDSYGDKDYNI